MVTVDPLIFVVPVNPEPWKTPPFSPGRIGRKLIVRAGKDQASDAYKQAVRETLEAELAEMLEPPYQLHLLFYRHLATYETAKGKDHTKHWADATNMQKLIEDALQDLVIENDKHVRYVSSQVIEQSPDAPGMTIVMVGRIEDPERPRIPVGWDGSAVLEAIEKGRAATAAPPATPNDWPGGGIIGASGSFSAPGRTILADSESHFSTRSEIE